MTKTLDEWWDGLSDDDRQLFLQHRDTAPLPPHVIKRFTATGMSLPIGPSGVEVRNEVREFLARKANDINET